MAPTQYPASVTVRWQRLSWLVVPVMFVLALFLQSSSKAEFVSPNEIERKIPKNNEPQVQEPTGRQNLREGSKLVDEIGYFRLSGDRATFIINQKTKFNSLENLNLERVVLRIESSGKVGTDNPQRLRWKVSGRITEFRGDNYLLISRAILVNKNALKKKP